MKKLVITIIAILTLIPSIAFASQSATLVNNNFHIYYNGITQHFEDASGEWITPIIVNGTTYLPVRAVAGLAGLDAGWDAATKTVKLTSGGKVSTHYGEALPDDNVAITVDTSQNITITLDGKVQNVPAPFIYNGTTYLPVRAICDMVGIPVEWRADTKTVLLGTYLHEASPSTTIPTDAKVLTDKDMIDLAHKYKDGSFFIECDFHNNPNIQLDFNTDGYKTLTFTVTTGDVDDKSNQDVRVWESDSLHGTILADVPQAYSKTKTYTVKILGRNRITLDVGAGMSANAIVSNIYLTK